MGGTRIFFGVLKFSSEIFEVSPPIFHRNLVKMLEICKKMHEHSGKISGRTVCSLSDLPPTIRNSSPGEKSRIPNTGR